MYYYIGHNGKQIHSFDKHCWFNKYRVWDKIKSGFRQVVLSLEVQQYPLDAINVGNYFKASMNNVSPGI